MLPVDAYYPSLNLVVEYREVQHSQATPFFDRKATLSGVSRGEQRRIYDERRRALLPAYGIVLIELDYDLFSLKGRRLLRDRVADEVIIRSKLKAVVKNGRSGS